MPTGPVESPAAAELHQQRQAEFEKSTAEPLFIQAKLTIGKPDDPLEYEADAMADKVMRMPETSLVQRKCAHCEEEEKESVQRKPLETFIQKKGKENGMEATEKVSSGIRSSRGNGAAMDNGTRNFMESRFGNDFSSVKIHTGHEAVQLSSELQAKAFTIGNDIYFNEGQYQPASTTGKHLLAHELTHIMQQNGRVERKIQRKWDPVGMNCQDIDEGKWLKLVVVQQEVPQFVTLHWSDGTTETGICSAGKGQCCTETSDEVACDAKTSKENDTNCTPITAASGYTITERKLDNGGWKFWNTFVPGRAIALHTHHTVNGEPLSHGCVRLHEDTARHIFCGAVQNKTRVQVKGFARPACNSAAVQAEWLDDIRYVKSDPMGDKDVERGIREVRKWMRMSYGVKNVKELDKLIDTLNAGNIAANMPRCKSKSPVPIPALSTPEESRVFTESININRFQLVFANEIIAFIDALSRAADLSATQTVVSNAGQGLWDQATKRAQTSVNKQAPDIDDRPLYWTRLRMIEEIRRFKAAFAITDADRQQLIDQLELNSRGENSVSFSGATAKQKKVLISGFDPFGLTGAPSLPATNMTIMDTNPSGAAVLALDGQSISGSGGLSAFIQGVIFPVRYRDFNAGVIENLFRPFLDGTTPISMIMTISQGGSSFEIENLAGRRRSTDKFADNEGALSGGSPASPVEPPGLAAGPEFLRTGLPHKEMSTVPQTTLNVSGATMTSGAGLAIRGTGGGFLSNEIFYRVSLMQTNIGGKVAKIPVGHLHVPSEDTPGMTITTIKDRIKEIIAASLPAIP